jgi:uncharacterized protein
VDFKKKLERLRPMAPPTPVSGMGSPSEVRPEPELGAPPAAAEAGPLADLRRQMAEILGRTSPSRPKVVDPGIGDLPFAKVERAEGPLYQRLERLRKSHHIGRMPVDAALTAEPAALALLSLDPRLAGTDPTKALFLDTETTGLGGSGTIAFLVGLAAFDEGELVVEQLFLRSPSEEVPLLAYVAERIRDASLIVSFNGKAFDVPTLCGRYVMNRLPVPPERPHFDLLHVARRLHRARVGSCTLKAVESEVLGFVRDADIDGGDVAPRYAHFLRTGDESVLRAVIDHNSWDVVSMAALVGLYGEPLGTLHHDDLVGLARTYRRAGALDQAELAADTAVSRGAGNEGLRVRGEIAKARGDRARALSDFEALADAVDEPRVRLELAKLYEHFVKEPDRALALLDAGTGEAPEAAGRRRARLERKARRARGGEG